MIKTIILAGGCFWGTAHLFSLVPGVKKTEAGYANSIYSNPSYQQVCTGRTEAAEAVRIEYDDDRVSLTDLLGLYYKSIDPTSEDRQGNDIGTQYRTGIYYTEDSDRQVIEASLATLQRRYREPLAIECEPLQNFYLAEEYHQEYLVKNPSGYCHIDPTLFEQAKHIGKAAHSSKKDKETLRQRLTPLQWEVTQNGATEQPYNNAYDNEFRKGIYIDITDGTPLFLSTDKFNSGCGWPAFSKPIDPQLIVQHADHSFGLKRTEVKSSTSGAHLGHVFNDGSQESGGLRYCINSASLRFIPLQDMAKSGYEDFIPYVK